jgi:DNA topoisomerase I
LAKELALIKDFGEAGISLLNGRFGPYIKEGKNNYKLPKTLDEQDIKALSLEEIKEIIKNQPAPKGRFSKKKVASKEEKPKEEKPKTKVATKKTTTKVATKTATKSTTKKAAPKATTKKVKETKEK